MAAGPQHPDRDRAAAPEAPPPDDTSDDTSDDSPDPSPDEFKDADESESMSSGHRRCIATRAVRDRRHLLRFVVDPDGRVVPDVDARLPGRGLWLSPGRDMIEIAARRRLFSRAARRQVTVPPDLADQVERLLTRRCLSLLGLARRAGQAVAGYEKVRSRVKDAAGGAPPAALFAARDGAADGRAKMTALLAAVTGSRSSTADAPPGPGPVGRTGVDGGACRLVVGFDAAELGQPLGRDRAVHVALDRGKLARALLEACDLLAGFRPGPMVVSVDQALASAGAPGAPPPDDPGAVRDPAGSTKRVQ